MLFVVQESTEGCSDHCSINNKYSLNVDCWMQNEHETDFLGSDHGLWCLQRNPGSPDFRHKVSKKALWIDGWSTPPRVKAVLKLVTEGKLQPPIDYRTKDSEDTTQGNT